MGSSRWVRAALVGVAFGAGFAACAQGAQLGNGGAGVGGGISSSSSSGTPDSGPMRGIGAPCPDGVCTNGDCTLVGNTKYCTTPCPPTCPQGTYCSIINGNPLCVPDLDQQCDKCTMESDCKLPSDACLTAPPGDKFCARDCTVDGTCPNGFTCTDLGSYVAPMDGGVADGGSKDGGAKDGGAKDGGGDAGGSDGGGDGGGGPLPTMPTRWCVPDGDASCPCNAKRDMVTHACAVTNTSGTCSGTETCDGKASMWMGCTAQTPVAETCNNKDDNCNGKIDEGTGNMLCASKGSPPPHASWACNAGMCGVGACDPGWTAFPTGGTTTGCTCQVDANEPNGSCAAAKDLGMIADVGSAPLVIQGTLSSNTNVDFYTFATVDTNEVTTNSYHVAVSFTAPSTNNEFIMDVMRGGSCSDTPSGAGTAITTYDWCVAGSAAGPIGEAPCSATTANVPHCTDHSAQYWVRVYRKPGATPTCTPYQITVTAGGGTCDFTQQCM